MSTGSLVCFFLLFFFFLAYCLSGFILGAKSFLLAFKNNNSKMSAEGDRGREEELVNVCVCSKKK